MDPRDLNHDGKVDAFEDQYDYDLFRELNDKKSFGKKSFKRKKPDGSFPTWVLYIIPALVFGALALSAPASTVLQILDNPFDVFGSYEGNISFIFTFIEVILGAFLLCRLCFKKFKNKTSEVETSSTEFKKALFNFIFRICLVIASVILIYLLYVDNIYEKPYCRCVDGITSEDSYYYLKMRDSQIKDYKDAKGWVMYYEVKRYTSKEQRFLDYEFKFTDSEQDELINQRKTEVEEAFRIAQEETTIQEETTTKYYATTPRYPNIPYVGMMEAKISSTSLGNPDNVRREKELIGNEMYEVKLYDFKDSGITVFTARCVKDQVVQVWDYRDSLTTTEIYTTERYTMNADDDPYDVNDYDDPEDFYYYNYDDFFDYYDAEDYYNENHD